MGTFGFASHFLYVDLHLMFSSSYPLHIKMDAQKPRCRDLNFVFMLEQVVNKFSEWLQLIP